MHGVTGGKGVDQSLGAGPLMTITTIANHREKVGEEQCSHCLLYFAPGLNQMLKDMHVGNCCFGFALSGGNSDDLAVACVLPSTYKTRECPKCQGQFYGAVYHYTQHKTNCNSKNTSTTGVGHSTITLIYHHVFM